MPRRKHPPDAAVRSGRGRRMGAWREQHAWCAGASFRRLRARPLGTALTVAVMGFALALPLAFWLLLGNVQQLGHSLSDTQAISVFMQPGLSADKVHATADQVRQRGSVRAVTVRTPEQGLAELSSMQGFSGALHAVGDNPLPFVVLVQPRDGLSRAAGQSLVKALAAMPHVDQVQDGGAWRQRLQAMLDVGWRATVLMAVLMALAALLVIGNSVRLDIQSRADEIAVLQLVGASRSFVRRPYLYAGLWYGAASGVVASLLILLLEAVLAGPVAHLTRSYNGRLHIAGLSWALLLVVPVLAAALGWFGARLVSARHLRKATWQ